MQRTVWQAGSGATPNIQGAQGPSHCGQQQQHGMAAWASSQHGTWALPAGQ